MNRDWTNCNLHPNVLIQYWPLVDGLVLNSNISSSKQNSHTCQLSVILFLSSMHYVKNTLDTWRMYLQIISSRDPKQWGKACILFPVSIIIIPLYIQGRYPVTVLYLNVNGISPDKWVICSFMTVKPYIEIYIRWYKEDETILIQFTLFATKLNFDAEKYTFQKWWN